MADFNGNEKKIEFRIWWIQKLFFFSNPPISNFEKILDLCITFSTEMSFCCTAA
jgi:hypothetical protein